MADVTRTAEVKLIVDSSGVARGNQSAASSVDGLQSHFQNAANKIGSALQSMGSRIGGEFGELLNGVGDGFDKLAEHTKGVGKALQVTGATAVGTGLFLQQAASKDQSAHEQLKAAVEASGNSYSDYADAVEKSIKHQENFAHKANDTQDALRILTQATQDPKKALESMNVVADVAAAKHISLSDAATKLAKAYGGNGKVFKEFGITLEKSTDAQKELSKARDEWDRADAAHTAAVQHLADVHALLAGKTKLSTSEQIQLRNAQQKVADTANVLKDRQDAVSAAFTASKHPVDAVGDAMTQLGQRVKGQAQASVDSFGGRLDVLKAKLEDQVATFGQHYGPAITAAGSALAILGTIMDVYKGRQAEAAAATLVAAAADDTLAASETAADAAGAPLIVTVGLVGAALAGLGVAAYELYQHWGTVWGFLKRTALDAWHGIDIAVVQPLEAAFHGIQAVAVGWWHAQEKVWNGVKDVLVGAWHAIDSTVFQPIHAGLGTLISFTQHLFNIWKDTWEKIGQALQWVWDHSIGPVIRTMKSAIDGVVSAAHDVVNLPGKVLNAANPLNWFAGGTDSAPGGLAVVGEEGPELVNLPRGSQVIPHNKLSSAAGGGGGTTIVIHNHIAGSVIAQEQMGRVIRDQLAKLNKRTPGEGARLLGIA